jgi:hypothetical protein
MANPEYKTSRRSVLTTITGMAAVAVLPAPTMCIEADPVALARQVYAQLGLWDVHTRDGIIDELKRIAMREICGRQQ